MKTCCRCRTTKSKDEFHKNAKKADGLQTYCKACKRGISKTWYSKVADAHKEVVIRRVVAIRRFVYDYLKLHPCVDCGESDPVVLEFDHVRGQKTANVSALIASGCSEGRISEEIAKCEVRCCNCHRRRTANQFGHKKLSFSRTTMDSPVPS